MLLRVFLLSLLLGACSTDSFDDPDNPDNPDDPDDPDDPEIPTGFRGIPERPFANVETPAVGDVEVGATTCVGTPENPAFMVGDGTEFAPPDTAYEIVAAENCIIANLNLRGRLLIRNATNVEVRDSEIHHSSRAGISGGGTNIAVVRSHIHHNWGDNGHAVVMGCGSSRIWVGENLLEYNDEDGFQAGHQCEGNEPDEIYFYGNECNNNRENCFDVKWTNRAVVSGNSMRRHRPAQSGVTFTYDDGSTDGGVNSGSDGVAIVIGSDGTPTTTFMFDNVAFDNQGCTRIEDGVDVYIDGHDCRDALGTTGGGLIFDKSGHTRVVNSSFDNVPTFLNTTFREAIRVSESDNTLGDGVVYRNGDNGTVDNETSPETVLDAFRAAFGRDP